MSISFLPDRILKLMHPKDRPAGKAGQLRAEAVAAREAKTERQLQLQLKAWLNLHDTVVFRQPCHKRSQLEPGTPDLLFCWLREAWAVEVKLPWQKPDAHQEAMMKRMEANGWHCAVVHSLDELKAILGA